MNKFWKWMEEKEYSYKNTIASCSYSCQNEFSKQILIGYMIEYIMESLNICELNIARRKYEKVEDGIYANLSNIIMDIENCTKKDI